MTGFNLAAPPPLFTMARWTLPLLLALVVTLLLPLTASATLPAGVLPASARVHGGPHDKSDVKAGTCGGFVKCGTTTASKSIKHTRFCYVKSGQNPGGAGNPKKCNQSAYGCVRAPAPCNGSWWKCKCDTCRVVKTKLDQWCVRA